MGFDNIKSFLKKSRDRASETENGKKKKEKKKG